LSRLREKIEGQLSFRPVSDWRNGKERSGGISGKRRKVGRDWLIHEISDFPKPQYEKEKKNHRENKGRQKRELAKVKQTRQA